MKNNLDLSKYPEPKVIGKYNKSVGVNTLSDELVRELIDKAETKKLPLLKVIGRD